MFERLDDPQPFTPGAAMQVKVTATGRSRRRRRRGVISGSIAVALAGAVLAPVIYLRQQAGQLERVEVGGLVPVTPDVTPSPATSATAPSETTPDTSPPALSAAINLLVVGVDARPPDDGSQVNGSRTDTMAVVRIDPEGPSLTVLSIPRDLWVPIDGGKENRINAALGVSREALVDTVSATLDVPINHYLEIDFAGFSRLIDLAGGVNVPFDAPARDRHTGFQVEAGCVRLDGQQSLAYVRSRYYETFDPTTGTWETDPTSDLGRMARQQDFGVRAVEQVLASSYGALDQVRILTDVLDDVTVDEGLDVDALRAIWNTAADAGAARTTLLTLDDVVRGTTIGGASVLTADPDAVRAVAAPLRGDEEVAATPPSASASPTPTDSASVAADPAPTCP